MMVIRRARGAEEAELDFFEAARMEAGSVMTVILRKILLN